MKLLGPVYRVYEWLLHNEITRGRKPKHIGVILDGNRRFGRQKGLEPWESHKAGAEKVKQFLRWCWEAGIHVVTLYTLSVDNLSRDIRELKEIFNLATEMFKLVIDEPSIHKYKVRVKAIGNIEMLPLKLKEVIKKAEDVTKDYAQFFLNVAIGYGGRAEILNVVKIIAKEVRKGKLDPEEISADLFEKHLYTAGLPDPDLIIRTSGEERISGFLLWQSAYSEFYFCEVYWPALRKIDLWRAIRIYQLRDRRYGR